VSFGDAARPRPPTFWSAFRSRIGLAEPRDKTVLRNWTRLARAFVAAVGGLRPSIDAAYQELLAESMVEPEELLTHNLMEILSRIVDSGLVQVLPADVGTVRRFSALEAPAQECFCAPLMYFRGDMSLNGGLPCSTGSTFSDCSARLARSATGPA